MKVELLKKKDINSYIEFLKEVFDYETVLENIEELKKNNKVLCIVEDKKVVASATIEERFEYIKNQKYYSISYLGVRKEYRKKGYASSIFKEIERLVEKNKINYIELTSGNQRRQAHIFYKSKSFKIKDTTVFVKFY